MERRRTQRAPSVPFVKKRAGSVSYKVEITDYAADFIEQNVALESVLRRFEWAVEMLSAFPFLGPAYDPEYIAARPPFPCRYLPLPDTPFTLYYTVDEAALRVTIIDIEWSAGDPRKRFPGL